MILPELISDAVQAAEEADIAVLFLGLTDDFESEGYDRTHMRLPDCQTALLEAVMNVQPNTVVVLHNGSPVELPWADRRPYWRRTWAARQQAGRWWMFSSGRPIPAASWRRAFL